MTNAISRLQRALETWSFKYNCYEAVHPWTPFCSVCALDIGFTVFGEAFKLYTPLYLFSQLMKRRFDYKSFKITIHSILRSTIFISTNAFLALLFFCSSQYLTGKFYYYVVAHIPGFLASAMAVIIEKPSRRSSLAFYVANVASETLFRIYIARGYLRPVKYGQVYIFTLAIAAIMFLAKKHGFEDDPLSAAIKLVVGPEEALRKPRDAKWANENTAVIPELVQGQVSANQSLKDQNLVRLRRTYKCLISLLSFRHRLCPHQDCSCSFYVTKAAVRAMLIGYSTQLGLRLTTNATSIIKNPQLALSIAKDQGPLKLGLFLSTFSAVYKASNCLLRFLFQYSGPLNCFVSGLVAGPSLFIYPSPTIALYVLWKCLEALFHDAVRRGIIVHENVFIITLYGLATSQLFYSALMDPRYMKRSYMAFLDKMSHHRLHMVNRAVLDVFGTEASSGYEDFFPDLHPKFMSKAFLGSIWVWMIEQKFIR